MTYNYRSALTFRLLEREEYVTPFAKNAQNVFEEFSSCREINIALHPFGSFPISSKKLWEM